MGTVVEVSVYSPHAERHADAAISLMRRLGAKLDWRNGKSEVAIINNMAGIAKVAVSHDTFDIISRPLKLSRSLGGVFDITVGPLVDLWRMSGGIPPSPEAVEAARTLVGWMDVELDPDAETVMLKRRGMRLNLDGVGKGYVVARARELLVSRGIKSAMISTGSSISVIGVRPGGGAWRVGIRDPRREGEIIGILELEGGESLSTSGDYERDFEYDGKRYHGIFDPRTGYPAEGCQSVTIIAPDATVADILSTAVFIMGPVLGLRYIENMSGIKGVIMTSSGALIKSSEIKLEEVKK
ncbi:MAG: FAD:protein FMN transferase [Candidatus Saganbacteria bacterium]|nr:FAD:protein FMN transferase [Candidatus Saganbacteria bacterium]